MQLVFPESQPIMSVGVNKWCVVVQGCVRACGAVCWTVIAVVLMGPSWITGRGTFWAAIYSSLARPAWAAALAFFVINAFKGQPGEWFCIGVNKAVGKSSICVTYPRLKCVLATCIAWPSCSVHVAGLHCYEAPSRTDHRMYLFWPLT